MQNILFMGRKPVAAKALEWLLEIPEINVAGVITDSHLSISAVTDVAVKHKIPIFSRENAEDAAARGDIKIDLGLSLLYWQKIRKPLLNNAKKGVINFHPAPLPDYKGTAGYNLAILEERNSWGVSAHYVDSEIDTGNIIEVDFFKISPTLETARTLEKKSQPRLLEQFKRIVTKAIGESSPLQSQPNIGGTYTSRLQMEAMKEVKPGDDIEKKIRAFWFPPYTGAYIKIGDKKYTLVSDHVLRELADPATSSLFTSGS